MRYEALRYSNDQDSPDISVVAPVTLNDTYADLAEIAALDNVVVIPMPASDKPDTRQIRAILTQAVVGVTGKKSKEDVCLAVKQELDGNSRVRLIKLGTAVFVASAVAVDHGRAGHFRPSACTWTGTTFGKALGGGGEDIVTGFPDSGQDSEFAGVSIYDVCFGIAIVRALAIGTDNPGTGCAPMDLVWR